MPVLDLTIEQVIKLVEQLRPEEKKKILEILQLEIRETEHPWQNFAGKYQNDPQFDDMLAYIESERLKIDDEAQTS
ncbi:MAG: hypothetical protein AB4368_02995 [Xenococcaceae cyanobacterium]